MNVNKKQVLYIFILISLLIFSLSAVSAADNSTDGVVSLEDTSSESISSNVNDLNVISSSENNNPAQAGENVEFEVKIIVSNNTVVVDNHFSYLIKVKNNGSSDATNVVINSNLPRGLDFTLTNGTSNFSRNGNNLTWNVGNLASGKTYAVEVTVRVEKAGTYVNTANVTSDQNKTSASSEPVEAIEIVNLELTNEVNTTTVTVGEDISYILTVTNNGPNNANNVVISDILPEGLEFVSTNDTSIFTQDSNNLSWNVGYLPNTYSYAVELIVKTTQVGTIINNATVTCNQNKTTASSEPVESKAREFMNITVHTNDDQVYLNGHVTFFIFVNNTDEELTVSDIVITEFAPDSFEFIDYADKSLWNKSGDSFNYNGDLKPGESIVLAVAYKATAVGKYSNTIEFTANANYVSDVLGISLLTAASGTTINKTVVSNEVSVSEPHPVSSDELEVIKYVDKDRASVGETITYTIAILNYGPDNATNVVAVDVLPDGLEFVSSDAEDILTREGKKLSWNVGELGIGVFYIELKVKATKTGTFVNTVTVTSDESSVLTESSNSVEVTDANNSTGGVLSSSTQDTLPATGNPVLIVLLALFCIVATGFRRRL